MSSNEDPQQETAYKWEDSFTAWAGASLTKAQAAQLIADACNKYRVPVPTLSFPRVNTMAGKRLSSQYDPNDHTITLRPRHRSKAIVLHEAAHAITDWILGWELAAHGPEWLGIYMVLLEDFEIAPRSALHASADAAGLKYRTRTYVSPGAIRRRYRRRNKLAREAR